MSQKASHPSSSSPSIVDRVVGLYGDLIFDLCECVLWSPTNAQLAFRSIIKRIKKLSPSNPYVEHERAFVLHVACEQLGDYAHRLGRRLTPSEQIMLDAASTDGTSRLNQFGSYFHRLETDDQILLLLRDKYGLPYPEISSALGLPEGSLRVKRAHALRTLEEWLWS